ncbi:MAG: hypothetical protein C0622_03005 [Desulfuromonas sp.]|nr:MAG: hypothetical protein C0622_03005 [Desulfuromonas sp.]
MGSAQIRQGILHAFSRRKGAKEVFEALTVNPEKKVLVLTLFASPREARVLILGAAPVFLTVRGYGYSFFRVFAV